MSLVCVCEGGGIVAMLTIRVLFVTSSNIGVFLVVICDQICKKVSLPHILHVSKQNDTPNTARYFNCTHGKFQPIDYMQ